MRQGNMVEVDAITKVPHGLELSGRLLYRIYYCGEFSRTFRSLLSAKQRRCSICVLDMIVQIPGICFPV